LAVLDGFGAYPPVIERELERYLPFLATTKVLMAAVRAGVGRERAHEAIQQHAMAVAQGLRSGATVNDLAERLAADTRLGLDRAAIDAVLADRVGFVGTAVHQVDAFCRQVEAIVADHPDVARYRPEPIL
jgi:adenylosuccinate lyase